LVFPQIFSRVSYQNKKQELGNLINQGIQLSLNHDFVNSLKVFDNVILQMPNFAEAYINKAVTLKSMKLYEDAKINLELALKYNIKDSMNIYLNFKDIYFDLGDTSKAYFYLRKAVESNTNKIVNNMISGNFYFNLKKLDSAYYCYKQALEERFKASNYLVDSIEKFIDFKKINGYIENDFDKISFFVNLNYDRGLAENYNKLGVILALQKKYKQALERFIQAVNIWKDYKDANDNIRFVKERIK